jgi:hypothetical protein
MNQVSTARAMYLPQVDRRKRRSHLPAASLTNDELCDLDVFCRVIPPIHATPDMVDEVDFACTTLAFDDDRIGAFEGVSDNDVNNSSHRHALPVGGFLVVDGASTSRS